MSELSKHATVFVAETLADLLLKTYQDEQVPQSNDNFAQAGFTRDALISEPDSLYRMIVVAAYDRRPFTQEAHGFECIWEMDGDSNGIPSRLQMASLWSAEDVLTQTESSIGHNLSRLKIGNLSLNSDGGHVAYSRTLNSAARLVVDGFSERLRHATTPEKINAVYHEIDGIHGIAETIASKLVKYTLREIAIGQAQPADFPLSVAWPLTREYHAEESVRLLRSLSDDLVPLTAGVLIARGDAFAIDALFYLHRNRPWELEEFVKDWKARPATPSVPQTRLPDSHNVTKRLMEIINEIVTEGQQVTQAELDTAGLKGIMTKQRVAGSCLFLNEGMSEHASRGDVAGMLDFYEKCLKSDRGQDIGWALDKIHRKSMESEQARFRQIAMSASNVSCADI